jgi:hypothetical protein
LRASVAAGIPVQRVEIDNGKIVVVAGEPQEQTAEDRRENEWDRI